MPPIGRGIRRLFRLRALDAVDAMREVDDEMGLHLQLRVEQLVAEGLDRTSAEAEARKRFARDEDTVRALYGTARERNRRMRTRQRWESLVQDTRYAARGLARDPVLAVFVVLTLALGVGANVTAFSLVDRLLVRDPAHVEEGDRVVRMYARTQGTAGEQTSSWLPWPTYNALRDGMTSFDAVGAYRVRETVVGAGVDARKLRAGQTTGAFFALLGVHPLRGRFPSPDDDAAAAGPLAVLSEHLWRGDFASDPGAIGRSIVVADEPHTIIGVAPGGFTGAEPWRVDIWAVADSRTAHTVNWHVVGRLRDGSSLASASADGEAVHRRTAEAGPRWMTEAVVFAAPIRSDAAGREPLQATLARWLAVVSATILLITLANVVNLLLVRLVRRRRELAIRIALGSGRSRVARLIALEGGMLALAAGVASLLVARVAEPVVRRALFAEDAGWTFSLVDGRILATLLLVLTITALIVGVVPALQAGDPRITAALRGGAQGGGGSSARVRSALTVVQAALCVVLLSGAGLFIRSLEQVRSLDLGVDADRVITARAEMPRPSALTRSAFREMEVAERTLYAGVAEAVRRLPGVDRASVAVGLPLDGGSFSTGLFVPGMDSIASLPGRGPYASKVGSDYFATVGTRLLRGRPFTEAEEREAVEPVVIVGETMARTLWPGRDALEGCVRIGFSNAPCARVVGIAADVHRTGLHEEPSLQYYLPLGHAGLFSGATLVVRPSTSRPVTWPALRQAILAVDPSIRSVELGLLSESLEGEVRPLRLGLVTFGLSGALALVVAVLGLYSLTSYLVAWRTREIGIRLALGATDGSITRLVVGSAAGLATLGVVFGLTMTLIAGRWLQPHLFETSAADPLVLGGVTFTLMGVAVLAGWVPARRALRISPTEALRAE